MDRASVFDFSALGADVREGIYGTQAFWNGQQITICASNRAQLDLSAGGYEQAASIEIFTRQKGIKIHDRITFMDKVWRVTEIRTSQHTPEIALTLEANK